MKRHANAPTGLNLPPKVARRESSIINPPPNNCLFDQNTQCGFGLIYQQIYPTKFIDFFKRNNHGVQTKIFVTFMCKISITFLTQKPSTDDQEPTFNTSTTPHLSLIPLPMPLRISFYIKPTLSKSTSLFLSFCNTESSDIIMPATKTSY